MKNYRDVLLAPVVSEKSYSLLDGNKYTFLVAPDANKTEIKIAVEKVFGVKVLSVNTMNREVSASELQSVLESVKIQSVQLCMWQPDNGSTSLEDRSPKRRLGLN